MAIYSQKEAVYSAISSFMHESNRPFDDGDKVELSSEDRKTVVTMLVTAIETGEMEFSPEARIKHNTPEKIRNYSTGLLSNWLRKDSRLNGGTKHSIKSPGSRIGQGDSILQSLKGLKKVLTDKREIDLVEKEIEIRVTLLQSEKINKVVIDRSHIPAHLLHLLKS